MLSQSELKDNEVLSLLPPVICNNLRVKLDAERASILNVLLHKEKRYHEQIPSDRPVILLEPSVLHEIAWNPKSLYFELGATVSIRKLRVCNTSSRSIYLQCGRFSNVEARFGASWCCLRRTRYLLAPGIVAEIYIKAIPRTNSPISSAYLTLQLAAAHKRDTVVALYQVPIFVKFLKYIPPSAKQGD